jgi:hypothetical protein
MQRTYEYNMQHVVTRCSSTPQSFATAAALILVLAAGGCERSSSTGNDSKSPVPNSAARTPLAANPQATPSPATASAQADPPAKATQPLTTSQATETPRMFVAYYFHRTIRCPTCLSIEKQSQEAIELAYGGELSAGRLEWQSVNIEEPGNEHFEKDFALERQSLTLVELQGAEVQRHKKLERVWELVEDPYGFQEYVVTEVALFLGGG